MELEVRVDNVNDCLSCISFATKYSHVYSDSDLTTDNVNDCLSCTSFSNEIVMFTVIATLPRTLKSSM